MKVMQKNIISNHEERVIRKNFVHHKSYDENLSLVKMCKKFYSKIIFTNYNFSKNRKLCRVKIFLKERNLCRRSHATNAASAR